MSAKTELVLAVATALVLTTTLAVACAQSSPLDVRMVVTVGLLGLLYVVAVARIFILTKGRRQ